jgi:type III pantothenate kinase
MLLVLDIGNTNVKLGVYDGNKLLFVSLMPTDRTWMEDQYVIEFCNILNLYGISPKEIDGAAISSVVPPVNRHLHRAVRRLTGVHAVCVGPNTRTGIRIGIRRAETVGADLVVGCVAAAELFEGPCIILDMGTATKFTVLDEDRTLLGGAIVPGVGIALDALTNRTAQLPSISLEAPEKVIGEDTVECMQSGVLNGTAYMIDGMCDHIEQELGKKCSVVATGGLAKEIVPLCERDIVYSDTLLLEGLRIIYENNRPAE